MRGADAQAGIVGGEARGRRHDVLARDVDGEVEPGILEGVEERADLHRRPCAELDDSGARAGHGGDLLAAPREDLELGLGDVVLRGRTNLLEQRRAALVVEVLRPQGLLRPGETFERVGAKIVRRRLEIEKHIEALSAGRRLGEGFEGHENPLGSATGRSATGQSATGRERTRLSAQRAR